MRSYFLHTACLVFFIFLFTSATAQRFGGNPARTKWRQINTDSVRVIFPEAAAGTAMRIADVVHAMHRLQSSTIGNELRKVSMVLQPRTLISNAYVGLGPYRSEFYTTAPQSAFELGAVRWTDNLAVHEFRHVQQYSNFKRGVSKAAAFIFGEEGQAVANAASVPDWFFEGDAVFSETALTRQGRGTLPFSMSGYLSLYQAGRKDSYMTLRNGSFKKYLPDHYDLGYLLVAYGRKQFGKDIWKKVTQDASAFKPLVYPFQGAVKKHTGMPFTQFVNQALLHYRSQWDSLVSDTPTWISSVQKNNVINYKYPYPATDGSLVVLKNSYANIPAFYRVRPGQGEEKIAVRGIAIDDYFSYKNERIVYATYQPDLRWANSEYHTLRILDLRTGTEKKVKTNTPYFSPDISNSGNYIAAVSSRPDTAELFLLNASTGAVIRSVTEADVVYSTPKFSGNDSMLFWVARNSMGEMGIYKEKTMGGVKEKLLPLSNRIIGYLQVQGDTLLFSTTYQGRDEIWAYVDGQVKKGPFRLASYATGLYQGVLQQDGTLVGSAFTADGYRLGSFRPAWSRVELKDELKPLYITGAYDAREHVALDSLLPRPYAITKYRGAHDLFNFHSWRPNYERPEYSFTVYGENVLNTFRSELGYTYNENEGSNRLGYTGIYGATYLQPFFGINQTWQRSTVLNKDTTVNWNELEASVGLRLPLNFSAGRYFRFLTIQTSLHTEQVKWTGIGKQFLRNGNYNYVEGRLQYSSQIQQAQQHIFPHWAQSILVQYRRIVNQYTANQLLLSGSFFLPGLFKNHSVVVTGSFQARDTLRQYFFSNNFPFSRGYRAVDFPRMWRWGMNYHFPIAYPDWGFGNIVYFKRVRANAFYDYTRGKSLRTGNTFSFGTAGGELYLDTRWWNQQPVTLGIRYSRLLDRQFVGGTQPNVWEFILPMTLFN